MRNVSLLFVIPLILLVLSSSTMTAMAGHHSSHKSKHKAVQSAAPDVMNTPSTGNYTRYDDDGQKIIHFGNYDWLIRPAGTGFPGPNRWSPDNVWLDASGYLHLALRKNNNAWYSSELYTKDRLSYGTYQFTIDGPIDKLNKNVVLGLYPYPEDSMSQDGSNEIDIEFSRWGNSAWPNLNYTVWPAARGQTQQSQSVNFSLTGTLSTHRFTWMPTHVLFQSMEGLTNTKMGLLVNWDYAPINPAVHISHTPQAVHMNLWSVDGHPPSDGKPVEVIIRDFKYDKAR